MSMTASTDILDKVLGTLNQSILASSSRLVLVCQALITVLLVLDISLYGIKVLLGMTAILEEAKKKLFHYIFWSVAFLVLTNPLVLKGIEDTAVYVGRHMADGVMSGRPEGYVAGPSQIMAVGVGSVAKVIDGLVTKQPVSVDMLANLGYTVYSFAVTLIASLLILTAIGALALKYIMAFVECSVVLGFSAVFLALAFFDYTEDFAERYLSTIAGYVMKLTLVVFIAQASYPMMIEAVGRFNVFTADGLMGLLLTLFFFSALINVVPQMPNDIVMGTATTPTMKQLVMELAGVQFARFVADMIKKQALQSAAKKGGGA